MLEAQRIIRGEGFNVTFSMTYVDGVPCDSKYVKKQLRGFLGGGLESAHTYVNHNANNAR